jgi:hypothetical protein
LRNDDSASVTLHCQLSTLFSPCLWVNLLPTLHTLGKPVIIGFYFHSAASLAPCPPEGAPEKMAGYEHLAVTGRTVALP